MGACGQSSAGTCCRILRTPRPSPVSSGHWKAPLLLRLINWIVLRTNPVRLSEDETDQKAMPKIWASLCLAQPQSKACELSLPAACLYDKPSLLNRDVRLRLAWLLRAVDHDSLTEKRNRSAVPARSGDRLQRICRIETKRCGLKVAVSAPHSSAK